MSSSVPTVITTTIKKNRLKTHKREVHYKGIFVCFVKTHLELKQKKKQKGCKSSAHKQIVHKHNDEMHNGRVPKKTDESVTTFHLGLPPPSVTQVR